MYLFVEVHQQVRTIQGPESCWIPFQGNKQASLSWAVSSLSYRVLSFPMRWPYRLPISSYEFQQWWCLLRKNSFHEVSQPLSFPCCHLENIEWNSSSTDKLSPYCSFQQVKFNPWPRFSSEPQASIPASTEWVCISVLTNSKGSREPSKAQSDLQFSIRGGLRRAWKWILVRFSSV